MAFQTRRDRDRLTTQEQGLASAPQTDHTAERWAEAHASEADGASFARSGTTLGA
jgi:hypothetical protein